MTEETFRIVLVTAIATAPGFLGAVTSFIALLKVNSVHKLVNSQLTGSLQRETDARLEIARIEPSLANQAKAAASQQVLDDHKQ